jgi:hypothetical protein
MNIIEATNNMIAGKRIVRASWAGYYLIVLPGQHFIWSIGNNNSNPTINASEYIPSIEDINATDWMIKIN